MQLRALLKMHFSPSRGTEVRDSCVSPVLEYPKGTSSSCISYTLRFSAMASCFALDNCSCIVLPSSIPGLVPPASMQSCARRFLALTKKPLFLDAPLKYLFLVALGISSVACVSNPTTPTIATLENKGINIAEAPVTAITRTQVIEKYRGFLDFTAVEPMYGDAMRRLADIEIETAEEENLASNSETEKKWHDRMLAAIQMYQTYLKTYPERENIDIILYQLAKAYDLIGEPDKSLHALSRLVKDYPASRHYIEAQFRRGEILFALQNYAMAELAYNALLQSSWQNVYFGKALFKYGWANFKQQKYKNSLEAFITILDGKYTQGLLQKETIATNTSRAEKELINDTLRVVSLSFSYLQGAEGIRNFFSNSYYRKYEPILYRRLAETYLEKERYIDAAETYLAYGRHAPFDPLAPTMHQRAIDVFKQAKLAKQQLETKKQFTTLYSVFSDYWRQQTPAQQAKLTPLLQKHLRELGEHYHAAARKKRGRKNYQQAIQWYTNYLNSFPHEQSTAEITFLWAEAHNETGQYTKAISGYEKAAYHYPSSKNSVEAGYAALLLYSKQLKLSDKANSQNLVKQNIESALRFNQHFPQDKRTAAVLTKATQQLYTSRDYARTISVAQSVIDHPYTNTVNTRIALTALGHAKFDTHDYSGAEQAYLAILKIESADIKQIKAIKARLAASIYKQGEQSKKDGLLAIASANFLRLGVVVPDSPMRITAEYDAATTFIQQQDWPKAETTLRMFRQRYPAQKKLQQGVTEKLALVYIKTGKPVLAANEMEQLAKIPGKSPAYQQEQLWEASALYQENKKTTDAARIYQSYIKQFPRQYPQSIEARYELASYYKGLKQPRKQIFWLKETTKAEKAAGKASTERTRYLAAESAITLAYPLITHYRKTKLVIPLKKSLKRKKALMQRAIKAYERAIKYKVADVTTSATYHIAEVYHDFSRALMKSQRPKGLSAEEQEQYDILLEEQAFPFEEKAIDIHAVNIQHTKKGVYDKWVKRSLKQLQTLQPIRYAKSEKGEPYVAAIQ